VTRAILVLALVACVHVPARPAVWTVEGEGPHDQALELVEAARRVYPALPAGGVVHLVPLDAYRLCYGPKPPAEPRIITGCIMRDGVAVAWPTPFPCADLACSALPHELAHAGGSQTEGAADAGALLITQELRKARP
jgi:hypothetical protein